MTSEQALRPDLKIIADLIAPKSRVLDVGCGDGELLAWLMANKHIRARGIEIDPQRVEIAMARGVPVIHGDVNRELADFPADMFDVVVLSQSLQMLNAPRDILHQLLKIAPTAIVAVPNFGHWRNRLYLGLKGKMPVTETLQYQWYDTPNIHFCTIADFIELCQQLGVCIEKRLMVHHDGRPSRFYGKGLWANLFGEQGIFLLRR